MNSAGQPHTERRAEQSREKEEEEEEEEEELSEEELSDLRYLTDEKRELLLVSKMTDEPFDRSFADEAMRAIDETIETLDPELFAGTHLVESECKQTTCRVTLSHGSVAEVSGLQEAFSVPGMGRIDGFPEADGKGGFVTRLYISATKDK